MLALSLSLLASFGVLAAAMTLVLRNAQGFSDVETGLILLLITVLGSCGIAYGVLWLEGILRF